MKNNFSAVVLAGTAMLAAVLALPAAAQTGIAKVSWESSPLVGKNRAPFAAITELPASPDGKFTDKVRAVVTLKNASSRNEEGLVLRYALRLQLVKKGEPREKAFWEVPYYVDELRVAAVKASSEKQARVLNFKIAEQFRRLVGSGFVPVALKMEIMLSPRSGGALEGLMAESVLEIRQP